MTEFQVHPVPSEEEAVAIVSAIETAWPRAAGGAGPNDVVPRWRWSGRWWTKPVPMGRLRPW